MKAIRKGGRTGKWGSWESRGPQSPRGVQKYSFYASALFQDLPREAGEEGDDTTNDVPHIQCEDGCDPQGLRDNSQVPR